MDISIQIRDNEYAVNASDPTWDMEELISKAHAAILPLNVLHSGDGWVILYRKDVRPVVEIDIERGVTIRGEVTPEGEDRLDGTLSHTEIGLQDRLDIAALIRGILH